MKRRQFLQAVAGGTFVASWFPRALLSQDLDNARDVYTALQGPPDLKMTVHGGDILVTFAGELSESERRKFADWIRQCAVAVSTYFGRFPVDRVGLLLVPNAGDRIGPATTYGFDGSAMAVHVGRATRDAQLQSSWVLVHEMVHLALPTVPRRSEWLLEGNATYVEPVARAQAGQLAPQEVWRWAVESMSKGQPGPDDQGLDHTHTWGRTYWGGALFWLMAEITIYEKSRGQHLLKDALRAINRASGGNTAFWSVERLTAVGDAAVGVDALTSLYDAMKDRAVHVDLDGSLKRLGVSEVDGTIRFDDNAPLATLRRLITDGSRDR